jgi:hypothetical protein
MAWFSRPKSPPVPAQPGVTPFDTALHRESSPQGRYGPIVRITRFDAAPDELTWQLPIRGELFRLMPGPDRPDYSVMLLEQPLRFYPGEGFDLVRVGADRLLEDRQGRRMVEVHALVLTARFVGQQLHPGMADLPVNVAYVIDHSLVDDTSVDSGKVEYVAVGYLTEGAGDEASPPQADQPDPVDPDDLVESVGREVATALRQGIADQRGAAVERLSATVVIDSANRLSGLTGNADGTAPEPTPETFERLNAGLAKLADLPPERAVASLTLHVIGSDVTVEATPRS